MLISAERLQFEAETTGFRPEILGKVIYLTHLLNRFSQDPYLHNRFVLKGGTALNLFYFDYPRLSVDIDINYIGSHEREVMLAEKQAVESAIETILAEEKLIAKRKPTEHAGGKWTIRYQSVIHGQGVIQIDLNFLDRVPLWSIQRIPSFSLGQFQATDIPVQDLHELAAGKLRALFSRHSSRDLFDAHQLLTNQTLNFEKLRLGFVLYGAASRRDWRTIQITDIQFDWREFQNFLIPLLRKTDLSARKNPKQWAETILFESQQALGSILPLKNNELNFLNALLDHGNIHAKLLTMDEQIIQNIQTNPAILWKALNVKKFKQR